MSAVCTVEAILPEIAFAHRLSQAAAFGDVT